jgi:hypothetical protein
MRIKNRNKKGKKDGVWADSIHKIPKGLLRILSKL